MSYVNMFPAPNPIDQAYHMGELAFNEGLQNVPTDDPQLILLLANHPTGLIHKRLKIAWSDGWQHAQYLSKRPKE